MGSPVELFVLGTSQSVAPAAVRERMHVELDEVYSALDDLLSQDGGLVEALPLSTCGRLEIYGVVEEPERALSLLRALLARKSGVSAEDVMAHSYVHLGADAVRHLFRVAAGLDSVVHGEAQILGQVRNALEHQSTERTVGARLRGSSRARSAPASGYERKPRSVEARHRWRAPRSRYCSGTWILWSPCRRWCSAQARQEA